MAAIRVIAFRGERPYADFRLLGDSDAQVAQNSVLESGRLKPMKLPATLQASGLINAKTLYRYTSTIWFEWLTEVEAVPALSSNDSYNRVIFTGDGAPKYTYNTVAGVLGSPDASYLLGLPPPSAPSPTVLGTEDLSLGLRETRFYVITYVDALGAEGPPSPATGEIEVGPGQYVRLNSIDAAPPGNYNVQFVRIYRTNTGSSRTAFQLVAEVPVGTASYSDQIASANLGETLVTQSFNQPSALMRGLTAHPAGFFIGFFGNTLAFSEPGFYYAWPIEYELVLDAAIVAVAVAGASVIIATDGQPYVGVGHTPGSMVLQKLEIDAACVSARSMVDMGSGVVYAGPNGLVLISDSGVTNITQQIFTVEQWEALTPTSMHAYLWRGSYLCFYSGGAGGAFLINPRSSDIGIVFFTDTIDTGYSDLEDGELYVNQGNVLKTWYSGSLQDYTWRTKVFTTPTLTNFGVGKVLALTYPVTFRLYADKVLRHTETVADNQVFRLPGGYRATEFEIELSGTAEVQEIQVGTTMRDLRAI